MDVIMTEIPDVKLVRPTRHNDHRGFFSEVWSRDSFVKAGIAIDFVQDNHSRSNERGTLRGLHFQKPPFAQTKLIRVLRGSIFDVAVDLRVGSPTQGRYVAIELTAEDWQQIFIPKGFAHGFLTLEPNTEVFYKVDAPYTPGYDEGIAWNDPDLSIQWPANIRDVIMSEKDRRQPALRNIPPWFAQ